MTCWRTLNQLFFFLQLPIMTYYDDLLCFFLAETLGRLILSLHQAVRLAILLLLAGAHGFRKRVGAVSCLNVWGLLWHKLWSDTWLHIVWYCVHFPCAPSFFHPKDEQRFIPIRLSRCIGLVRSCWQRNSNKSRWIDTAMFIQYKYILH